MLRGELLTKVGTWTAEEEPLKGRQRFFRAHQEMEYAADTLLKKTALVLKEGLKLKSSK